MDIEWALTGGSAFTHKLRRKLLRVWVAPGITFNCIRPFRLS